MLGQAVEHIGAGPYRQADEHQAYVAEAPQQRAEQAATEAAGRSDIPPDEGSTEDISMEDVLGAGTVKPVAAAKEAAEETPVETPTI